jgi:hypothetical protein
MIAIGAECRREARTIALRVEARDGAARVDGGLRRAGVGEYLDHAAGRIAVKDRERPAQHLDARGGRQVHVRDLPLAIGHRRRDSIDDDAHAADAEGRPRAEAAYRELQVLRVILPVEDGDARHARKGLGHIHHRARVADHLRIDHGYRSGDIERPCFRSRRRDDDGLERDGRRVEHYSALMFASLKRRA